MSVSIFGVSGGRGVTFSIEDDNALADGFSKLTINRQANIAGSVSGALAEAEIDLGIVSAGAAVSAGITGTATFGQQFTFEPPTRFPEAQSLVFVNSLIGVIPTDNPAHSLLNAVLTGLEIFSDDVGRSQSEVSGAFSLAGQVGAGVNLGVGLEGKVDPSGGADDTPPSLGFTIGELTAGIGFNITAGVKGGFKQGVFDSITAGLGITLDQSIAKATLLGVPLCPFAESCQGVGFAGEAKFNVPTGTIEEVKYSSAQGRQFTTNTKSFKLTAQDALLALRRSQASYLANLIGVATGAGGATPLISQAAVAAQPELIFAALEDLGNRLRLTTEVETAETFAATLALGAKVQVAGVGLGIGVSLGGSDAFKFIRRRGVVVGQNEFLLESYEEDQFVQDQNAIETAEDLLVNAFTRVADSLTSARQSVTSGSPTQVGNSARGVQVAFTPGRDGTMAVTGWSSGGTSSAAGRVPAAKALSFIGSARETLEGLGMVHNIQAESGVFRGGTLELSYSNAEIAGADETALRIARFNDSSGEWEFLTTEVDAAANKAIADINDLGMYTLFKRIDAGCPTLNEIEGEDGFLRLFWTALSDSTITAYNVFRTLAAEEEEFTLITQTPVTGTSFEDRDIDLNGLYRYRITGVTATGGETCASNTMPNDADDDNLADQWETHFGLSTSRDSSGDDPDNDGLINLDEHFLGADPTSDDTDDDGLPDELEHAELLTSPTTADTDGDGINDGDEIDAQSDPTNADSDGDGLNDGEEVLEFQTDPINRDSDGDGLNDRLEVRDLQTDPLAFDSDGDGLSDRLEVRELGTDASQADTDGDGQADGLEIAYGSNPLDAASTATTTGPKVRIEPERIRSGAPATVVISVELPEGFATITGASAIFQGQEILPTLLPAVTVEGNRATLTLSKVTIPPGFFGELLFRITTTIGSSTASLMIEVP